MLRILGADDEGADDRGVAEMKVVDRRWVSRAPRLTHVAPFDGIRGIGIFGVMIGHSFPIDTLSFAAIVDVFFVISGFLITTLLLQEHRSTGSISVRKFYARRSLRLMPLLYVFLVLVCISGVLAKVAGILEPPYYLSELATETVAAAFYVHNIVYPFLGGAWLGHLWTLSVEEQFYLLIGVVMMVVLVRGGIRAITAALVLMVVAIQVSRGFGIVGPLPGLTMAVWLQRPDSLMVGMLGAILNAHLPDPLNERTERWFKFGGYAGIVGIFVAVWGSTTFAKGLGWEAPFFPGDQNYIPASVDSGEAVQEVIDRSGWVLDYGRVYWIQWGFTLANWSFLLITLPAFRVRSWWPNRLMSIRPIVVIGAMLSYGLYLWHYPVQHYVRMLAGTVDTGRSGDHYRTPFHPALQLALDVVLPFALAIPTYFLVERKALEIKNRFQVEKTPPAGGAASKAPAEV